MSNQQSGQRFIIEQNSERSPVCEKMTEFLVEHNLFDIHAVLIYLNNGEVGHESVNVFQAQAIRESLIQVMT